MNNENKKTSVAMWVDKNSFDLVEYGPENPDYIKVVEYAALEAAQKRILECETEMRRLRNAAYHGLLEATAFMGIPEWKRENFIANQMSNFDFILDMAMKPGESTKFQLALSQTSGQK